MNIQYWQNIQRDNRNRIRQMSYANFYFSANCVFELTRDAQCFMMTIENENGKVEIDNDFAFSFFIQKATNFQNLKPAKDIAFIEEVQAVYMKDNMWEYRISKKRDGGQFISIANNHNDCMIGFYSKKYIDYDAHSEVTRAIHRLTRETIQIMNMMKG